jgi:hypothetical protein
MVDGTVAPLQGPTVEPELKVLVLQQLMLPLPALKIHSDFTIAQSG